MEGSHRGKDVYHYSNPRPSKSSSSSSSRQRICFVCDFFYPNMGGVETHIWCMAQCLLARGHKVIIVTHAYEGRQGIRYLTNGLKVYYLPLQVVYDQVILPTLISFFPLFRNILLRERITLVHGHQGASPLTNETLLYARTLGMHTCYTDHSLFGFQDLGSIHVNKVLQGTLSDVDHSICVSHACRENLVLRTRIHPSVVSTIPNAVDSIKFQPDPSQRPPAPRINIVVISRLVYRKGIDLLANVIPRVCAQIPNAYFIIGGNGPKLLLLEEMREKYQLHDRMELLGAVPHDRVRDVLVRGHLFLNCSLTESFCIALLEAASCGLFVISTEVGGVPEVLPPSMIKFAPPTTADLSDAVIEAISECRRCDPYQFHERIKGMYNWFEVARRTEEIYEEIHKLPLPTFPERLARYFMIGPFSGILACVIVSFLYMWALFLEWYSPVSDIEPAPDTVIRRRGNSSRGVSR